MKFTKMHGLGNDFVVTTEELSLDKEVIAEICDRHKGVGADGFIIVTKTGEQQIRMKYWNADGSEAEMCGNGLRCTVKYAVDNDLVTPGTIKVQTAAGERSAQWDGKSEDITVQVAEVSLGESVNLQGCDFINADAGNPHVITFVKDVSKAEVKTIGPKVENDQYFPNKTNVEFIEIISPSKIKMRVWERGVGETMACGTGMVASALVSVKKRGAQFPLLVEVLGGTANIWIDGDGFSCMSAPAVTVFIGEYCIDVI